MADGELVPDLGFLSGQPAWLLVLLALIAATAFVVRGAVKRSGDTGNGREALEAVDSATDYLADKAIEERDLKRGAEQARDAALADLAEERARLVEAIAERDRAQAALDDCEARVREHAQQIVDDEERRDRRE